MLHHQPRHPATHQTDHRTDRKVDSARDDDKGFILIKSIHPEATVHLLAIPTRHVGSTEALEAENREMFLQLVDYAISQGHALVDEFPKLQQGFTLKMHFGSYESVPHAKLHILGME